MDNIRLKSGEIITVSCLNDAIQVIEEKLGTELADYLRNYYEERMGQEFSDILEGAESLLYDAKILSENLDSIKKEYFK